MSAPVFEDRRPPLGRLIGFVLLLGGVSWGLGAFSAFPWAGSEPGSAALRIAFKHVAALERGPAVLSTEEMKKLPRHMRPTSPERSRGARRVDTLLQLMMDGQPLLEKSYSPTGFRHDGPTFAYEDVAVPPGTHVLEVSLTDGRGERESDKGVGPWQIKREIEIRPGQTLLIEFSDDTGFRVR